MLICPVIIENPYLITIASTVSWEIDFHFQKSFHEENKLHHFGITCSDSMTTKSECIQ